MSYYYKGKQNKNTKLTYIIHSSSGFFLNKMTSTKNNETTKKNVQPMELNCLLRYFQHNRTALDIVRNICTKKTYSFRLIEYFVRVYAAHFNLRTKRRDEEKEVFLKQEFEQQRKVFKKKRFDCFRRNRKWMEPFVVVYEGHRFETNVGQLQFFKFFIENGGYDYLREHHEEVLEDYYKGLKQKKKNTNPVIYYGETKFKL